MKCQYCDKEDDTVVDGECIDCLVRFEQEHKDSQPEPVQHQKPAWMTPALHRALSVKQREEEKRQKIIEANERQQQAIIDSMQQKDYRPPDYSPGSHNDMAARALNRMDAQPIQPTRKKRDWIDPIFKTVADIQRIDDEISKLKSGGAPVFNMSPSPRGGTDIVNELARSTQKKGKKQWWQW